MISGPNISAIEGAAARLADQRRRRLERSPERALARGVVPTPWYLARFCAAELHRAAIHTLGLPQGLSSPSGALVDPACGSGVFFGAAHTVTEGEVGVPSRWVAFDVDRPVLSQAERALAPGFASRGWQPEFRAENPLEIQGPEKLAPSAERIFILGNPPWVAKSMSRGIEYSDRLLEDFRRDTKGERLPERRLGVLSDDYVRFIRWGAEMVRLAPKGGGLGFLTSSSYLGGPLYRAMRRCLLRWFTHIEICDFGGGSLARREGRRDDNLFGVRPGVAWLMALRAAGETESRSASVSYRRVWGSVAEKEAFCLSDAPPPPTRIQPCAPHFVFGPKAQPSAQYLEDWVGLEELFSFHAEGVQTNRDQALVDTNRRRLIQRINAFICGERRPLDESLWQTRAHYRPEQVRERLKESWRGAAPYIYPIAYRPFSRRWYFGLAPLCHRPRPALQRAVAESPWCLLSVRKDRGEGAWNHASATDIIADSSYFSSRSGCRTRVFPVCDDAGNPTVVRAAQARLSGGAPMIEPDDVHCYALAVLSSAAYVAAASAGLRLDYPRLPRATPEAWRQGVTLGRRLREALMSPAAQGAFVHIGHRKVSRAPRGLGAIRAEIDEWFASSLLNG